MGLEGVSRQYQQRVAALAAAHEPVVEEETGTQVAEVEEELELDDTEVTEE